MVSKKPTRVPVTIPHTVINKVRAFWKLITGNAKYELDLKKQITIALLVKAVELGFGDINLKITTTTQVYDLEDAPANVVTNSDETFLTNIFPPPAMELLAYASKLHNHGVPANLKLVLTSPEGVDQE